MQITKIDQKLKSLFASERKITFEILLLIQTLDITKAYLELAYSSLFEYLVKEIGYSESAAQRRIASARMMKQVPAIERNLQTGELNMSQVAMAQTAIRQQEKALKQKVSVAQKAQIFEKMRKKSTYESQKILKEVLPHFEIPMPRAVPGGSDQVYVSLQFSEKEWEKIQSLQAHFSHSVPDVRLESLLLYWHLQIERRAERLRKKDERTEMSDKKIKAITQNTEIGPSLH